MNKAFRPPSEATGPLFAPDGMTNIEDRISKALRVATDTVVFEIGQGVSAKVPELFERLFPQRKAVVVTDNVMWARAGKKIVESLAAYGVAARGYVIDKVPFHAEWKYIEVVDKVLDGEFESAKITENDPDYVEPDASGAFRPFSSDYWVAVSVGAGTINDLCKLCSHHHGQSYISVPTAASVDGFTSFGASVVYHNSKQTFDCPAPEAIVADVDIIVTAPKEMTAAGYADLAAKIPAGAEWMIADFVGSEPIIPQAWSVLQDVLDRLLSNPEGVAAAEPAAVSDLFEGLTLSGFAMQAARSSRPASCCDHLFSHIMDMTEHRYHGRLQSHGYQVAIGTLTMCAVFEQLFKLDLTQIDVDKCVDSWPGLEQEQQRALEIFKDFPAPTLGYDNISIKYESKDIVRGELLKLKAEWPELKARLQAQVYSFEKMQGLFKIVGAPYDPSMIGLSRRELKDMFPKVQLMRHRFNLLDLAKRGGFYDAIVEPVFAPGGAWDLTKEVEII